MRKHTETTTPDTPKYMIMHREEEEHWEERLVYWVEQYIGQKD